MAWGGGRGGAEGETYRGGSMFSALGLWELPRCGHTAQPWCVFTTLGVGNGAEVFLIDIPTRGLRLARKPLLAPVRSQR